MTGAAAVRTLPVRFAVATAVAVGHAAQRFEPGVHHLPADVAQQLLDAGDAQPVEGASPAAAAAAEAAPADAAPADAAPESQPEAAADAPKPKKGGAKP